MKLTKISVIVRIAEMCNFMFGLLCDNAQPFADVGCDQVHQTELAYDSLSAHVYILQSTTAVTTPLINYILKFIRFQLGFPPHLINFIS